MDRTTVQAVLDRKDKTIFKKMAEEKHLSISTYLGIKIKEWINEYKGKNV